MAINISEQIKNNAVDGSFNRLPSIDSAYGPYSSTASALTAIPVSDRAVGLTVGIKVNNTITEYWFSGGTANINLVVKGGGSSGGGLSFQTSSNVTDTTTYLNATFPDAAVPTIIVDTALGGTYIKYAQDSWIKLNGTILGAALPTTASVVGAEILAYK